VFNLGADEVEIAPGAFVVYQGTHGDRGAARADVILPGAAYPEKNATYVNLEGRVQIANRSSFPPGDAREDWAIIRALSEVVGRRLPYDSLTALRRALYADHPHLAAVDAVAPSDAVAALDALAALGGSPAREPFRSPILDFYLTNPIARASRVLAECSSLARGRALEAAE
jgi:NADH-quinone oxidoreductase subunit G